MLVDHVPGADENIEKATGMAVNISKVLENIEVKARKITWNNIMAPFDASKVAYSKLRNKESFRHRLMPINSTKYHGKSNE